MAGVQKGYYAPPQSSGGQVQEQRYQNAPFAGFKLAGAPPPNNPPPQRRPGAKRWTVAQLRASDAIIPLQSGTNQFASQRGMTGFGSPRNTTTPVFGGFEVPPAEAPRPSDAIVPLQYGTNQYDSQRGMTGFGQPRDVTGKHLHRLSDEDLSIPPQDGTGASWQ